MAQTKGSFWVDETECVTPFERIGKRGVVLFIWVFFIANQFPHTTTIKEIAFYGSMILFFPLFLTGRISVPWNSPFTAPALVFSIVVTVGSFWALNKSNTSADLYSHLVRYVILGIIITSVFEKRRDIEILFTLIVVSATFFCLYSMIDQYIIKKLSLHTRLLAGSQEITTNLLGIHIILSINLALYKVKLHKKCVAKICCFVAIIVLLLALFATQARSSFLALVLSTLIIFLSHRNLKKLAVILFFLAVAASYSPLGKRLTTNLTTDIRIQHMLLCLEVVKDYPLTGIGFGMQTFSDTLDLAAYNKRVEKKYPLNKYATTILTNPHNLYSDLAVRTGLFGFLAFIFFIYSNYWILLRALQEKEKISYNLALCILASLSSFLLIGFFEPVFSHPFEAVFCLIIAITHMLWNRLSYLKVKA